MSITKRQVSVALLVMGAFLGGIFFVTSAANLLGADGLFGRADAQRAVGPEEAVATAEDLGQAFSAVAERVNPAVVQIRSTRTAPAQAQTDPFGFGIPFGGGEQSGLGSGAFISADGYVVTNNHVVEDADQLTVVLFDGRELDAEVVGADPFSDLAVLRVEGDDHPALAFGDSDELRVGQWVIAVGSPLDAALSNTVTHGIVSSVGRYNGGRDPMGRQTISNYIQTDAAVNPGNSGGPLVNLRGEIIGINSAIATRTGTFNGISFAIPSNIVRGTVEQLIDSGVVQRGFLGISFQEAPPSLRRAVGVGPGAALVAQIAEDAEGNTPAADAGIRVDDLITGIDGVELSDSGQIVSLISNKRPGDTVELTYNRDGRERTATVTLGRRPGDDALAEAMGGRALPNQPMSGATEPTSAEMFGVSLRDFSARERRQLGSDVRGVLVAEVDRSSEAYRDARIREGMVIVEVDRQPVASVSEVQAAIADVDEGDSFLVRIETPNGPSFLTALTKEG